MATIEQFFLERYEQMERERDDLRSRVAELGRAAALDADHGEYGVLPGGRIMAVRVSAIGRYYFSDKVDECLAQVEELERGGNPRVRWAFPAIGVDRAEFPWSFQLVLPGRSDYPTFGVKVNGDIREVTESVDYDDLRGSLGEWVSDLDAEQDLVEEARRVCLRSAREKLETLEKREKTDEA